MNKRNGKWWLAVALCCLAPMALAERGRGRGHGGCDRNCTQVPEGGSTAIYLLGAGVACFGAMFLRSKVGKSAQS